MNGQARIALVVSGTALVVSLGSLSHSKRRIAAAEDGILKLEAENAVLKGRLASSEQELMAALAARLDSLREDLGLPGDGTAPAVQPFEDALVSKVGKPAREGREIRVLVSPDVLKTVLESSAQLAAEVSISPVVENKRPYGYSLFEVRQGGLAQALGFEQGDVIRAVNGKPFTTSAEVAAVYDDASSAKALSFEVSRNGEPISLVVEVQ